MKEKLAHCHLLLTSLGKVHCSKFRHCSSSAPEHTSTCLNDSSLWASQQACPKLSSTQPSPASPPALAPPAVFPSGLNPSGAQAKTLQVILNASFFHPTSNPSIYPVGLTLKYRGKAITSDHLHCRHQRSPGFLPWPSNRSPCFRSWRHHSLFSAKWSE